ncbi:MAG: hypothetical protein IKC59_02210, partial [Clostridia bacterium]|nr:hypothetical protein [Clostridia bacterium]
TEPNSDETTKPNPSPDPDPPTPDDPTPEKPIAPIIPLPTGTVKVACVGDSLTYGNGHTDRAYPIVLQSMLGSNYVVRNFGAGGRTATEGLSDEVRPDRSYNLTQEYRDSIAMQADIVIISLGTNDIYMCDMTSDAGKQGYITGMKNLIADYRAANAKTIYIGKPPHGLTGDLTKIDQLILPLVEQIADECGVEMIDFYTPTKTNPSLIDADKTHLTAAGYEMMAEAVYAAIRPRVRIACVGDSLTFGANATPYPTALQALLGSEWHEVRNFGAEGRTMTLGLSDPPNMTDRSYYDTKQYKDSLVYQPDIVILCLGTNDAWRVQIASDAGKAGYVQGLTKLVNSYYEAGVQQVYVCLPPDSVKNNIGNLVEEHVIPLIEANAEQLDYKVIDCFTPTKDRSDYLQSDQLHLNTKGYAAFAQTVFEALVKSDAPDIGGDDDFIPITVVENEKIKDVYDFEEKFE